MACHAHIHEISDQQNNVPVSPIKLVQYWSHAFRVIYMTVQNQTRKRRRKKENNYKALCVTLKCKKSIKQNVSDNVDVCILTL